MLHYDLYVAEKTRSERLQMLRRVYREETLVERVIGGVFRALRRALNSVEFGVEAAELEPAPDLRTRTNRPLAS